MKQTPQTNGKASVGDLVDYIKRKGLTVGDRLPSMRQLAAELGLGMHPVRDAFLAAQTMGIIKVHPRAGAFVQSLDYTPLVDALASSLATVLEDPNLAHLIEARRVIEIEHAAQAAARRKPEDYLTLQQAIQEMEVSYLDRQRFLDADDHFHLSIAAIAGNTVLTSILRTLLALLRPFRITRVLAEEDFQWAQRSHREIVGAIMDGNAENARAAMSNHGAFRAGHD